MASVAYLQNAAPRASYLSGQEVIGGLKTDCTIVVIKRCEKITFSRQTIIRLR